MELQKTEQISFEKMIEQARLFIKSGFLPKAIDTPEKAVMVMMTGRDLGLSSTEALRSINIIQGKPTMAAQLMLGLCYKTGQVEDCKIVEEKGKCSVTLKRRGQTPFTAVFSMEDAKGLQLTVKDNYIKQPATMYRWRALSQACRIVFPDAISGLYTPEEIAEDVIVETDGTKDPRVEVVNTPRPEPAALEAKPHSEEIKANDIPEDRLPDWIMPAGKYKGMKLADILGDQTATGTLKGLEYLIWLSESAQDEAPRTIICRFLEFARKVGLVP